MISDCSTMLRRTRERCHDQAARHSGRSLQRDELRQFVLRCSARIRTPVFQNRAAELMARHPRRGAHVGRHLRRDQGPDGLDLLSSYARTLTTAACASTPTDDVVACSACARPRAGGVSSLLHARHPQRHSAKRPRPARTPVSRTMAQPPSARKAQEGRRSHDQGDRYPLRSSACATASSPALFAHLIEAAQMAPSAKLSDASARQSSSDADREELCFEMTLGARRPAADQQPRPYHGARRSETTPRSGTTGCCSASGLTMAQQPAAAQGHEILGRRSSRRPRGASGRIASSSSLGARFRYERPSSNARSRWIEVDDGVHGRHVREARGGRGGPAATGRRRHRNDAADAGSAGSGSPR